MTDPDPDPTPSRWRLAGKMAGVADGQAYRVPHRPRPLTTAARRRRWERDLVIAAAVRQGLSRRLVARAFGMALSSVCAIVDGLERRAAPRNDVGP